MKIIVSFIVCGLLIMSYGAYAQDTVNGKKQLFEQAFFSIVRGFHPVMKQAQIAVDKARASLVIARAGFDPVFYFNNNQRPLMEKLLPLYQSGTQDTNLVWDRIEGRY